MTRKLRIFGTVTCLAALAACSSTGGKSSDSPAATSPSSAAAPAPTAAPSSAPEDVYTWYTTQPVSGDVAELQTVNSVLITKLQQAISSGQGTEVPSACSSVQLATLEFQSDLPSPDSIVNADLRHAFALYLPALAKCAQGDFDNVGDALVAGNKWTSKATARISASKP